MKTRMRGNKLLHQFATVDRVVIPYQHDGTAHSAQQTVEESNHLLTRNVQMVKASVHSDMLLLRADQHSADDIDTTVVRDTGAHMRRLSSERPSAFERRYQRKSTFVLKTQACAEVMPLFLSVAMCNASNAR